MLQLLIFILVDAAVYLYSPGHDLKLPPISLTQGKADNKPISGVKRKE